MYSHDNPCEFHGTSDIDGRVLTFALLLVLLLLLMRPRITSSAAGHDGRGPGSGVYVNVSPVA